MFKFKTSAYISLTTKYIFHPFSPETTKRNGRIKQTYEILLPCDSIPMIHSQLDRESGFNKSCKHDLGTGVDEEYDQKAKLSARLIWRSKREFGGKNG